MAEIYTLRIKRGVVGSGFPFDRVYLVKHGEHACLKQLFRYALIMPVEGPLKTMLSTSAMPDEFINRTFERDDDELEVSKLAQKEWQKLLDENEWVMAVPILTRFIKNAVPRYLAASEWYRTKYRRVGRRGREKMPGRVSPFPTLTYLQTPEKNIRPVCVMCARYINHQNGECHPGQEICYENLSLGMFNYFKDGLDKPDPTPNIQEPEIEEMMSRGDLQDD